MLLWSLRVMPASKIKQNGPEPSQKIERRLIHWFKVCKGELKARDKRLSSSKVKERTTNLRLLVWISLYKP